MYTDGVIHYIIQKMLEETKMISIKKQKYILLIILLAMFVFVIWQNNSITTTVSDYSSSKIPAEFNNFKIAQISDLHNKRFGFKQSRLLKKLEAVSPDVILVTGDLIDRRKYNLDAAMDFIEGALRIAPVYYVSGNHEAWSGQYSVIKENLQEAGVIVLEDEKAELTRGGSSIIISGVSDPDFLTNSYIEGTDTSSMEEVLKKWSNMDELKILISHRPELFDLYVENSMDIIFAGHAHGGQFRMPFIGGLVAPDQGLFPKYTSGSYVEDNSTMYVSRGLGNSIIPVRMFNRPEIVVVNLKAGALQE
jgi:predicted MPP superfamily phosphohydrolase